MHHDDPRNERPDRLPGDPRLDNVAWHALTTVQAPFAETCGGARRYHPDVSVFAAIDTGTAEEWRDLARLIGPGGTAALFRGSVPAPPPGRAEEWEEEWGLEWEVLVDGIGHQLVFDPADAAAVARLATSATVTAGDMRPLTPDDEPQMAALVALTEPGPWRPRTIELGDYFGVFDGPRLVAMAGERQKFPGHTEVSAVCTHPDARRRGLGAAVTARVTLGVLERGETPFLHHTETNPARSVYEALGFRFRRAVEIRILRLRDTTEDPR